MTDVPVEMLPLLASNEDFLRKMARLRYLKEIKDVAFNDKKDERGVPVGEFGLLRLECGALVSAAGAKSAVYQDLRITNTEPSVAGTPGSGAIEASSFAALLSQEYDQRQIADPTIAILFAVIAAARGFDEEALLDAGVPAHVIARSRGIGKGRSGSTRVEWVGKKGRGAGGKQGAGGPVQ